jgi:hypothetical protein
MAIGRISGQLLKDNLTRAGRNLTFDNDLLHLDVTNRRVGVNTTSPSHTLQVVGTTRTTNLTVDTTATLANITVSGNEITTTTGQLNLLPNNANAVVVQAKLQVDSLELTGNNINGINGAGGNQDINFRPQGTGKTNIYSDVYVDGNLHATGSITADGGTITLGDANTDNVVFNADINSDIRPNTHQYFNLGSNSNQWLDTYTKNLKTTLIESTSITVNGINLVLTQGKIYYVAVNGNDTKSGSHQNDPFLTIKKALTVATSGDTVYIYPGTYSEIFPLTVPVGVTVRGSGIRSVLIQPTAGTRSNDAFLLNGEVTIEDITIGNFEYNAGSNTGYAFRYATNFRVTSRSPYIRNISVITAGSTVRLGTNPANDPRGFLAGDAGKGALFDGSVANATSKDVSILFHSATFITPGVNCITITNGVKVEWLNSFIYFALRGYLINTGSTGQFGTATTGLKIAAANRVGTWAPSNTLTYYDTDGTTVLGTGTIASVSGDWVYLTGNAAGFQTITDRVGKTAFVNGGAKLNTSIKKFGTASLRLTNSLAPTTPTDYIQYSSSLDFGFGTADWTMEGQFYILSTGQFQTLLDTRTTAPEYSPMLAINDTGQAYVNIYGSVVITGTTVLSLSTWHHLMLVKYNNQLKLYVNGVQEGSTYADTNDYGANKPLRIGANYNLEYGFNGYVDEVRVSVVARKTANFTTPTIPYLSDVDTALLLHLDGVNNSTLIVDDGASRQDLRTSAGGTATLIQYADYTKFGAEIRSIGSANVYGTYGYVGDGPGVIAYLISQNFAYVGANQFTDNDPTRQIAANEIVKTNGAKIYYTSVDNKGDFKVGDYFSIDQKTGAVIFNGSSFNIPTSTSIILTDGVNTTTIDATKVETGNLNISGNTISSLTGDIILAPSSGNITINSSKSLRIPIGTTPQRPASPSAGMLRFNTTENWFEGYVNGAVNDWIPLGQVTDLAKTTYIKAEATPGAGDKTLYFYANNTQVATLDTTALTTNRVDVGNFKITSNTITPITDNTDVVVQPSGTGGLIVSNIKITTNTIANTEANAITTIQPSGTGFVRIPGTNGVVIPTGPSQDRPAYAEIGMIRYNSELGQTEVYSGPGTGWVSVTGTTGAVNVSTANDIALLQALIFG